MLDYLLAAVDQSDDSPYDTASQEVGKYTLVDVLQYTQALLEVVKVGRLHTGMSVPMFACTGCRARRCALHKLCAYPVRAACALQFVGRNTVCYAQYISGSTRVGWSRLCLCPDQLDRHEEAVRHAGGDGVGVVACAVDARARRWHYCRHGRT